MVSVLILQSLLLVVFLPRILTSTNCHLPFSALPADEWFVETAKSAINKLLLGASGSETSDIDEDHIIIHDEVVSDSDTVSSLSTMDSTESFASASMAELDSPSNLSDPDN